MSSCAAHPESLTPLEPYFGKPEERLGLVHGGIRDSHPRVRLEAMRALARIPTLQSASLILDAAIHAPKDDPQYEFAAWLSINDLAEVWTKAVLAGEWKPEGARSSSSLR